MSIFQKTILVFSFLSFFSCQKEEQSIFNQNSITELTENFVGQAQTRTQLRLAFGKTVANALVHPEFRKYIKKTSETDEFKGFNEIVFALHQDDQVTDELTLKGVLNAAIDEEVKALFGYGFLDMMLEQDPLVAIKLPDFYYSFDWNAEKVIPMVSVKTPVFFPAPETGYFSYLSYHHTGYSELLTPKRASNYFSLVVKYSEDYILWEDQTFQNEKGIPLFEILPQAETCWDLIATRVNEASIEASQFFDLKYLKKRDLFYYYQQLCEPGFSAIEPCGEDSPWDCPNADDATVFLESFDIEPIFHAASSAFESQIFQEGMHIAIPLNNGDVNNVHYTKRLTIIGYRKCEFVDLNTDFELSFTNLHTDNLGRITLPVLTFDRLQYFDNPRFKKDVNVYLFTGWPIDKTKSLELNLNVLFYEDEVNNSSIPWLFREVGGIQTLLGFRTVEIYILGLGILEKTNLNSEPQHLVI